MLALTIGCTPLTDRFDEAVATAAASQPDTPPTVVTEADLTPLPAPVGRWLRRVGVVGRPRVRNFVVDMHAQLNRGPDEPWMETPVLQVSFVANPTRLFLLRTRMKGLPVTGLHAYTDDGARMQIRVAGLVDMVDESGDAFTRAETVTMLNDVCIMAPRAPRRRRPPPAARGRRHLALRQQAGVALRALHDPPAAVQRAGCRSAAGGGDRGPRGDGAISAHGTPTRPRENAGRGRRGGGNRRDARFPHARSDERPPTLRCASARSLDAAQGRGGRQAGHLEDVVDIECLARE
jgi:hypothetical protein